MDIDINEINLNQLEIGSNYLVLNHIKKLLNEGKEVNEEVLSWIVNPPITTAAAEDEETRRKIIEAAREQERKKPESIKLVKYMKKEFYDFLCTDSEYYQKYRAFTKTSVNGLIAGLSNAMAKKIDDSSIGVVVITSFVTAFFMTLGKLGKKITCKYLESSGQNGEKK